MNAQTHDRQAQRPGRRMSTVAAKVAKQIAYQCDEAKGSSPAVRFMAQVVDSAHLSALIAAQTRHPFDAVTKDVKAELERLVTDRTLERWEDVYGKSARADRAGHYVIAALLGDPVEAAKRIEAAL